ncbi:MAG: enoyl-CoA hydratase-related protein [Defluviicoccus sp.]|nr:enoyl-CoA hydratase-related protein [Defluviicoccus sp.]MDE0384537.1 enoyl-CoA hydratase-related protein [Defluviicoccus sp.]
MEPYRTIGVETDARGIASIALDRPERRNAIDPVMMDELLAAFDRLGADDGVRAIVLRGNGKVFSAGGDLNWMRDTRGASEDEVARDSARLQRVYAAAAACPRMLVGRLHGAAMAGALGLVACCDVAIAEADTKFCLSEVRLGLAPGIIAGFLLPRIGAGWFRYLATGAVVFGTETAARAGLVHEVAADEADLDARVEAHCRLALAASPEAIAATKALLADLGYAPDPGLFETGLGWNVRTRMSDAAQEGIGAFLERRKARWVVDA